MTVALIQDPGASVRGRHDAVKRRPRFRVSVFVNCTARARCARRGMETFGGFRFE